MTTDNADKEKDGAQTQPGQKLQDDSEQTSAAEKLTSEIEAGKQYTGAEVLDILSADGRKQKDRADKAEGEVKRLTGIATDLTTKFNTVSGQVAELLKAQDEAEFAKIPVDDIPAQTSLRARQANRAEKIRLEGVEAEAKRKLTEAEEKNKEADGKLVSVNIKLAAMTVGVDEKILADMVPDGNPERLKKMAGILKQSMVVDPTKVNPDGTPKIDPATNKPFALTTKPASPVSVGGETKATAEKMLDKAKGKK